MGPVSHHRPRPRRVLLALALLAALLAGCDLFRPARPEVGTSGGTGFLPNYSDPESCLYYMAVGIGRKDRVGQDAYLGALADSTKLKVGFHALFDPAVWNAYSGTKPADWDLDHEAQQFLPAFINLFSDPYEMVWGEDQSNPHPIYPDPDHVILFRHYEVRALRQAQGDSLLIAVGYAELTFAHVQGRWAMIQWKDKVDPDIGALPVNPLQQSFSYRRLNAGT
jgi:hypothetical protein